MWHSISFQPSKNSRFRLHPKMKWNRIMQFVSGGISLRKSCVRRCSCSLLLQIRSNNRQTLMQHLLRYYSIHIQLCSKNCWHFQKLSNPCISLTKGLFPTKLQVGGQELTIIINSTFLHFSKTYLWHLAGSFFRCAVLYDRC